MRRRRSTYPTMGGHKMVGPKTAMASSTSSNQSAAGMQMSNGVPAAQSTGEFAASHTFLQTTRYFAVTLRELAKCTRIRIFIPKRRPQNSIKRFTASGTTRFISICRTYTLEGLPTILSGLLALFCSTSRIRFRWITKIFRPIIDDQKRLRRLEPSCDTDILRESFSDTQAGSICFEIPSRRVPRLKRGSGT